MGRLAAICAVIGILGVLPIAGIPLRLGKGLLGEWALAVLATWLLPNRWLRAAVWWALIGVILKPNQPAFVAFHLLVLGCLSIATLSQLSLNQLSTLCRTLRWIALIQMGWMLVQGAGMDRFFQAVEGVPSTIMVGLMDNTTHAGAVLAILSPLFCTGWWWLWVPLVAFLTFSTGSEGAMLVLVLVLAWQWWRAVDQSKRAELVLCVFVPGLVAVGMLVGQKILHELLVRGLVWARALELTLFTWWTTIFGWGIGQFKPAFRGIMKQDPAMAGLEWTSAHNEYIEALFCFGIVGAVLWLGFIWSVLERLPKVSPVYPMLVAWLLVAAFQPALHISPLGVLGVLLAGSAMAVSRHERCR